jgi:hypothetical protein
VLARKLKALKEDIKRWNKQEFGDVGLKIQQVTCDLVALDLKESLGGLSPFERDQRGAYILELEKLAHLEEISWRQKSRVLWLKERDNNTKFFHQMANSNRRRNFMEKVDVDGIVLDTDSDIRERVVQFHESLYQEKEPWRPTIEGLDFSMISDVDKNLLERRFDKEEILQVITDLQGDKSPGPDNFTMAFFQKCWSVLEHDLMEFFEEMCEHCSFESSLNATIIALIPKEKCLEYSGFSPH